jgi:hypothetical protein
LRLAAAATLVALAPVAAQASVVFSIQQVGTNVVITGSGRYNLTGATLWGTGTQDGFINPSVGLAVGAAPSRQVDGYMLTANGGAFGTGGFHNGTPDVGDLFGLDFFTGFITVYQGYVSGTALSGSTTFANSNFSSLGLTVGTYTYLIPNDTVTVTVPEPASLALVGLALGAGALTRRRQRAG